MYVVIIIIKVLGMIVMIKVKIEVIFYSLKFFENYLFITMSK